MLGRKKMMRAASLAALIAAVAAPVLAQQTATPPPVPATVVVPPVQVAPLPVLSAAQASQLVSLLAEARYAHGLVHDAKPADPPATNDALVRQALDYAKAVHAGRLDTADFQSDWGLRPAAYDPLPGFTDAVARNRIAQWLNGLPPPYAGYDYLKSGLDTYRRIEASGGWTAIAAGPDLALGATGPRVAALRKRLALEDAALDGNGDKYDEALKAAVIRAQNRYGLNPTGAVSTQTRAALNVPVADRVRAIMANMERWRWLPQEMPKNRIQVNIASAQLAVFEGDRAIASMKAVTGAPGGRETPMLWSKIHSVVLNPPWNVPAGIAAKELFPKGGDYLARNGFKIIGEGANRRLQQQPGMSALGRYKFDFDNPYAVYLHDTPSQSTFSRFDRLASHGCIRLEKPAALARLLLKDDPEWTPERIQATVATVKTTRVPLKVQPEVFLLYWSAFGSTSGTVSFRGDPYGWDKVLAAKIEKRSAAKAALGR
jgi:murein L,D-transpeptidase YcbB/YkuD